MTCPADPRRGGDPSVGSAPHYADERVTVYAGDSLDVLAGLPAASVDAVVTDPALRLNGLEFMGRDWDSFKPSAARIRQQSERDRRPEAAHNATTFLAARNVPDSYVAGKSFQAWCETWAAECLRILKPGGHLLAFGGTRTYHRLASAIEDAGFEIRDSITWVYASGFPKSLDVSKAIDKRRTEDLAPASAVAAWLVERMAERGVTRRILDEHFGTANVAQQWTTPRLDGVVKPRVPRWEQWERLRLLLGFGTEMDAEVWRLNGRKGTPGEAFEQRPLLGEEHRRVKGGTWSEDATGMFRTGEKTVRHTAPATDAAADWEGWGTALKPATEPIVVARKPLAGTVAVNVLTHGTGALNIDACRVAHANPADRAESEGKNRHADFGSGPRDNQVYGADGRDRGEGGNYDGAAGRWPSNLVLAHAPGCQLAGTTVVHGATDGNGRPAGRLYGDETVPVFDCADGCPVAELDAQSGELRSPGPMRRTAQPREVGMYSPGERGAGEVYSYGDSGGASRFFPVFGYDEDEKARAGCVEGCPVAELDAQSGQSVTPTTVTRGAGGQHGTYSPIGAQRDVPSYGDSGGASRFFPVFRYEPKAGAGERPRVAGAAHPTVKPLALMRWLVRLVTPPGGVVLEPFAGSGTTVEACLREGFRCVAVERDESYLPLIDERIRRSLRPWQPPVDQAERVAAGEAQPSLFDDLGEP